MATTIKHRRGTASAWTTANPILSSGEIGFETDTNKIKIGDGVTAWNSINYPFANLDGTGKVPASQLPSYVDDVLEYADLASFPVTGTSGIIYVALDTSLTYRWSGSVYVRINDVQESIGSTGTAIQFDLQRTYGLSSPETGNITANLTGAKSGMVQMIRHNHSVEPTFGSEFKKAQSSLDYAVSTLNYIYCEYISASEILYSITQ